MSIVDVTSETLSLKLEELDDTEFEIPTLDAEPTLESILNEDDTSIIIEEELNQILNAQVPYLHIFAKYDESSDTTSVNSSLHCNGSPAKITHSYKYDPGGILRHFTLKTICTQIRSACDRMKAGYPSAMAVSNHIAIGMSNGLIMVFDSNQCLRWCHDGEMDQCSVSAMDFNSDCTRLLAGYARGVILMFDVADGKVLRTMHEAHAPMTAVLHIKFTDFPTLAVCSDSGGSVFEMSFKRTLGIRGVDSKCIFSGSRGEVCCLECLSLNAIESHPLFGSVIIALATLTKLIVVSIRPNIKLLLTHTLAADPCSLPCLSWQFVVIQLGENSRIMDPVLLFARDKFVNFYQVNSNANGKIKCTFLRSVDLNYSLLCCHWMNMKTISLLDTRERLHILDVRNNNELETLDLSSMKLVYNSSHFKGIFTGGNVSKALALAAERACYNTVKGYGNQVFLLGLKSCHVVTIRNWIERLDTLIDKGRFEDALRLGVEFLEEKGNNIASGTKGSQNHRQKLIKKKLTDILTNYIDVILNGGSAKIPIAVSINTIVDMALGLEQSHLLFERLWDGLVYNEDVKCQHLFLKGLVTAVMDEKINEIPPEITQKLIDYLSDSYMLKELELCVINLRVECLDIEQVMKISRSQSLHSALICVWNRAMLDYVTPLHELMPKLQIAMDEGRWEYARDLGNTLLVYISCCFSSRGYPSGNIDAVTGNEARNKVFQCICNQHNMHAPNDDFTYPYLRTLLKFDMREFLNVLSMAFKDPSFSHHLKQRLTDLLIAVVYQSGNFKAYEVGWLLTFLRKESDDGNKQPISVDAVLYEKVALLLTAPVEGEEDLEKRQNAFASLIAADDFKYLAADDMLNAASHAKFYAASRSIYEKLGSYCEVFKCYLLDDLRKSNVFEYVEESRNHSELECVIADHIDALLEINCEKTGIMIGKLYPKMVTMVAENISGKFLYQFLKGAQVHSNLEKTLITRYVQLMCEFCDEDAVLQYLKEVQNVHLKYAVEAARRFGMRKATAFLLERRGDFQGAFDLLFQRLEASIAADDKVEEATEELVALAERGSAVLEANTTWLPLLQCLLNLRSHELLRKVLKSADLHVASELHLLLQHSSGTLGDFRNLIMGLFAKCRYEYSILKSVKGVVHTDSHVKLEKSVKAAGRGVRVGGALRCSVCQHLFTDAFLLFRCGHGYHAECLQSDDDVPICCLCQS